MSLPINLYLLKIFIFLIDDLEQDDDDNEKQKNNKKKIRIKDEL